MPSSVLYAHVRSRQSHFIMLVAALCLLGHSPKTEASPALAAKYACTACHLVDKRVVGPSWQEISGKYKDNLAAEQLAASIKKGGSGKWGAVPMPAQPQVPDADLSALATWILQGAKP